jgi:hypothetical protein
MEGRLTWHTDQQTSLHPMFNITTEAASWYEYENIFSINGTLTEGLEFAYEMTQPYNNHFLHAVVPAFEIMNAMPDSMAVMVAYDAGNYKTIGSNIEFGGLTDGTFPSTKEELLSRILEFFGDILTGTEEKFSIENTIDIKAYPNPFKSDVTFSFNLASPAPVTLEICDLAGRVVATLVDGRLTAGDHRYSWNTEKNGNSHPGGLYIYRFKTGNEIKSGKLMLIN